MRQSVLVHGAENFVGQQLIAALSGSDWAAPIAVSTLDLSALDGALPGCDLLVQCVVGSAPTVERGAAELYSRLKKPMRVVHLSSMTVYGSSSGLVAEDSELRADLGAYSRAQRDAERLAEAYGQAVILRPGGEYGPGCPHWTQRLGRLLAARRLGDLGRNGDGYCNLLYIDDLIRAILQALRLPNLGGQAFNLSTANPPTWNDYLVDFGRALGAVPVRRITQRRLKIEARLLAPLLKGMEIASKMSRLPGRFIPPPLSPSMLQLFRHEIQLDVRRAEQILDMRWTDRGAGLARAAAWYRES